MRTTHKYNEILEAIRMKATEIMPVGSVISLFGSRARGDFHTGSDWDLHILIPGDEKPSAEMYSNFAWPFSDIGLEFDEIINPRLYSVGSWQKRSFLPFFQNVEHDKIVIFRN